MLFLLRNALILYIPFFLESLGQQGGVIGPSSSPEGAVGNLPPGEYVAH